MEELDLFDWLQIWAFKKSSGSAQKLKHVCRRCSLKSFITNIQSCKQKGKLGSSQKSPAPDGSSSATMNIFLSKFVFAREGKKSSKIVRLCGGEEGGVSCWIMRCNGLLVRITALSVFSSLTIHSLGKAAADLLYYSTLLINNRKCFARLVPLYWLSFFYAEIHRFTFVTVQLPRFDVCQ